MAETKGVTVVPCPRWLRGRLRMGGCLQNPEAGGYPVSIVQNPTISLADDVAVTKRFLPRRMGR